MPQLVHEGEGLLGFRILLSDHDDGAITVIQAKAQNQALFGNLPFAVVSIATEYQYTARFYRCPITIKCIVLRKPQPLAGNMGRFGRVIARQLWRFKSRYTYVVQLFAKAQIYFALSLNTLDQQLQLAREFRFLICQGTESGGMDLGCVDWPWLQKEKHASAKETCDLAELKKSQAVFPSEYTLHRR